MDIYTLIQFIYSQRQVADYMNVSAAALITYDYILTLHLEIKFLWSARWTYTTVMFLLVRYLGIFTVVVIIWGHIVPDVPSETCQVISMLRNWGSTGVVVFAEAILALRTWAVWHQNKVVGVGLGLMTIAHFVSQFVLVNEFSRLFQFSPPLYAGFRGCFFTHGSSILWINLALTAGVEAVVLMLMSISAVRICSSVFSLHSCHQ